MARLAALLILTLTFSSETLATRVSWEFEKPAVLLPPSNDNPCSPISLTAGATCSYLNYNNNTATATTGVTAPGCANYVGADVWFSVVVPASGAVTVDLQTGTITDSGMAFYTGISCTALTLLECDDDDSANGNMSSITRTGLTPGSTLFVRVWEYGGDLQGTFGICATALPPPPPAPANDNPCGALVLNAQTACTYIAGTTVSATNTAVADPLCAFMNGAGDVWYSTVVPASGAITVDLQTGTITDSGMAIYTGTCSSLTLLECDDDDSANGAMSSITRSGLTPGSTIFIRVWQFGGGTGGTFGICVQALPPPPPCSDCSTATSIASLPFTMNATTCGGCNSVLSGAGCTSAYLGGEDYLFQYTPTVTQNVNIALSGTLTWTGLFVTNGCPTSGGTCVGTATSIAGNPVLNNVTLTAGQTYFFIVDTYPSPDCTPFTISVGVAGPPPPPNENGDSCTNATPFCTGTSYNFPNNTGQAGLGAINCLFSSPNPVWYYMQIEDSGELNMSISQTNTGGTPIDVDFNLWGPFTSQADGCSQITAGIAPSVDCSFSASAFEEANIPNAIAGEFYVLLLTNFSGQAGTISFNNLGTSTATTNCALLCNITNLTATPTACSPSTNTFDLNGVITVANPPNSGVLTVTSSCGGSVTIPQPWGANIPYTLPALTPTGGACTVTATFSEDATCTRTQNFTSPAPCSSVVLNCPQYASTSVSPNVACANQTYYLEVENTGCNGTVTFNVVGNYGSAWADEITWSVVSNLTGGVVASGGPGVNGGAINTTVGPLNANLLGTVFTLNVFDSFGDGFSAGGTISITQNGITIAGPITGNFGANGSSIFGANVIISAATMTINTPSGNVVAIAQNCNDFRVPITLENDNFCNTINVNLPWTIVCNATGATLSSGSQNITVHPSVPNDASDVVDITWNSSTCQWQVNGANDCDLLDIGNLFTISPNPLSLPAANCTSGSRTFTVDYLGISGGPDCCETGGPLEQVVYDQSFPSASAVVASSPFGGINNSAYLVIPGNNIGGEATSISLDIDLTGYCFNPPGAPTASDYWITVIADGVIIYDGQSVNPGPVSTSLLFDISAFPFGYNSNTDIEIYVYPNAFSNTPGTIFTTYNPSANCASLADGVWTGQLTAVINATFEELAPTPTNCTFAETLAFDCCDYTPVTNVSQNICNGNAMTQLASWQATVNASLNSCISYSSVTPVAGSVLPNNLFPTGVNNTTSPITQTVSAYAYCDANGSGTVNVGDTYSLISTYSVTIYPNANANISYNGAPYCTDITAAQLPVFSGTTGGTYSALPSGLSINATTGAINPSASSAGTYTVNYTIPANAGCPAYVVSTTVTITALPPIPTLTPEEPCANTLLDFVAGNGVQFEFFVDGVSQGPPSSNTTFTTTGLPEGTEVCVESSNVAPFVLEGNIIEPQWGSALAKSAGGPATSGFGAGNNLDAVFIKNMNDVLYGAVASAVVNNSNNRILMFIDCEVGGHNSLSTWTNRTNAPYYSVENLSSGITFDTGFAPDYVLAMNQATGDAFFDLYHLNSNTNNYLGSANTSPTLGYVANAGVGDNTKGFEFAIPFNALGNPSGSIQVFLMLVNDPGFGVPTFLSNQFLTPASAAQANYGAGAVNFGIEPPQPILFPLSADCVSQACVIVNPETLTTPIYHD